jgi:hypothetical protein
MKGSIVLLNHVALRPADGFAAEPIIMPTLKKRLGRDRRGDTLGQTAMAHEQMATARPPAYTTPTDRWRPERLERRCFARRGHLPYIRN